jgi:hypothetical protein
VLHLYYKVIKKSYEIRGADTRGDEMKTGETRVLKSGIQIIKDKDSYGESRYTAVDPRGYLGRTRIAESFDYRDVLQSIREYIKNNK